MANYTEFKICWSIQPNPMTMMIRIHGPHRDIRIGYMYLKMTSLIDHGPHRYIRISCEDDVDEGSRPHRHISIRYEDDVDERSRATQAHQYPL